MIINTWSDRQLLTELTTAGCIRHDGIYILSPKQGEKIFASNTYCNLRLLAEAPYIVEAIARRIVQAAQDKGSKVLIGVRTGGALLAKAAAELSQREFKYLEYDPKTDAFTSDNGRFYRTSSIIVEDVISTGLNAEKACQAFRGALDGTVHAVFCAVRRDSKITALSQKVPVSAMLNLDDFFDDIVVEAVGPDCSLLVGTGARVCLSLGHAQKYRGELEAIFPNLEFVS